MNHFKFSFRPKLLDTLDGYDRTRLAKDVAAGLTVSLVALPLAMAFAIASGVKPAAGIFTAIIAGFLVSALGGSRVQIGGPAGAFIVVILGIIDKYGLPNLLISTVFAGVLLFAMGVLKLGSLVRYVPVPIVIGFTNGIATLIALSQMKDFLGLKIEKMPIDFFAQVMAIASHLHQTSWIAVVTALISLAILFLWPKMYRSGIGLPKKYRLPRRKLNPSALYALGRIIPGTIVVLVLATCAVGIFNLPLETIGSRFGGIPQELPEFTLPSFSWESVKQLLPPTLTIALLGAIESLMCARVADNITGDRHDPNQELMAQGIANFLVPFFGGLPATGTIARTVTNIRAGATSPIAGMVHAVMLLVIVLVAAPLAKNIPLASLAAILLFVAFNMGEWHEFVRLKQFTMNYRILMVGTFLLTVIVDLPTAVEVGLVLACVFFIYRISSLTHIEPVAASALGHPLPEGVAAYSIFGSLFFGAVGKLEALIDPRALPSKAMILEMHQLINLDTTGLDALDTVRKTLRKHGSELVLCGLNPQPLSLIERTGFLTRLGAQNCVPGLPEALARVNLIEDKVE